MTRLIMVLNDPTTLTADNTAHLEHTRRLVRTARAAGARQDRATLRAAAEAWVEAERAAGAWWSGSWTLGICEFEPAEAGLLLLSGQGLALGAGLARRVLFVDGNPDGSDRVRPLGGVPTEELSNYCLRNLAWQRLLAADWRPVPPLRRGRGLLRGYGQRGYTLAAQVLAAFAARDPLAVAAAIRAAAALEGSRRFSLLAYALACQARALGIDPQLPAYAF